MRNNYCACGAGVKGFTLVELMVAVSILSIGIVLVLNSYIGSASVIDHIQNRLKAIYVLEQKMNLLEKEALKNGGVGEADSNEEAAVGVRSGMFVVQISPIQIEAEEFKTELKEELDGIEEKVQEVKMSLSWKEGNKNKDETLSTYLPSREKGAE